MNTDKAREFFSAYYEGALEGGLKQSFELALRTDAALQSDYSAFVETIQHLDELKHEDIEIPTYLSDRIATRLEAVQAKPKFGFPAWTSWMRGLAFSAVAVAAITFALPLFKTDKSASMGGFGGSGSVDQLLFKSDGSNLILNYQPSGAKTVVVSSPVTGKEIEKFNLDGQRLQSPIINSMKTPAIFRVEVLNEKASSLVVIPGSTSLKTKSGDGSVQDLAMAIAGYYHVPVVIDAANVDHHVSWNFTTTDALAAANQAVANEGFSVDQRTGGLIKILDR